MVLSVLARGFLSASKALASSDNFNDIKQDLGEQILEDLESPQSDWPVDTGLSKNSFTYFISGGDVWIDNLTDYGTHVEDRTGVVEEVIHDVTGAMNKSLLKFISQAIE